MSSRFAWTAAAIALSMTVSARAHREPAALVELERRLEAAEIDEEVVEALVQRAALERLRGDFGAALADLNEAYALDPEHPKIALQRGLVLALLGYLPEAKQDREADELIRVFEAAASPDRDTARARELLGKLLAGPAATPDVPDEDAWDDVETPGQARTQLEHTRKALRHPRR